MEQEKQSLTVRRKEDGISLIKMPASSFFGLIGFQLHFGSLIPCKENPRSLNGDDENKFQKGVLSFQSRISRMYRQSGQPRSQVCIETKIQVIDYEP